MTTPTAAPRCVYCQLPLDYEKQAIPRPIGAMPWRASDGTRLCIRHPQYGERNITPHRPDQRKPATERATELTRNG